MICPLYQDRLYIHRKDLTGGPKTRWFEVEVISVDSGLKAVVKVFKGSIFERGIFLVPKMSPGRRGLKEKRLKKARQTHLDRSRKELTEVKFGDRIIWCVDGVDIQGRFIDFLGSRTRAKVVSYNYMLVQFPHTSVL